jgi:hypothetical protein
MLTSTSFNKTNTRTHSDVTFIKCKQAYLLTACYLHTCTLALRKCSVKTTPLQVSALPHLYATEVDASLLVSRSRELQSVSRFKTI